MDVKTSARARSRLLYCCVVMAVALGMVACARSDGQSNGRTAASGTLSGRVTRGPMSPVSGPGIAARPAAPVAGAELKLLDSKGVVVATARTDGDGLYRLTLPPGNYRVVRGAGFSGAARNLPAMVAISPGGRTRLDIWVDTGIR
ncbi:MAG TPA: carboxypeptidase-like regulatory domain-containing protein [Candidatus Binataceae bacterium]|nr:carboxypeptidase-like regulatory domain-containing protein [Candidatus Binataceae bacterium]